MTERSRIKVREVMNSRYILVDGLETVRGAFDTMKARDARCIIVRKREPGDEYGIVLLSDIAKKVIAPDRSPDRVNVYEIMSKPVLSVSADMDVRYTARLFDSFGIALAPVMEDGEVIGVVTYADIVIGGLANF